MSIHTKLKWNYKNGQNLSKYKQDWKYFKSLECEQGFCSALHLLVSLYRSDSADQQNAGTL